MILTPYTQTEYFNGISNLLPNGKAWDRDATSGLYELITAIAGVYHDQDVLFCDLIDDVFPATSTDLLEVWQQTLDLTAGSDNLIQQHNKVVARLSETGSIAKEFYISYASALGYTIDIIEYSGIISGFWRIGDQVGTCSDYSYQFDITIVVEEIKGATTLDAIVSYDAATDTLVFETGRILWSLPTTDPANNNQLWNNGGVVCISSGTLASPTDTSVVLDKIYNPNDGNISFLGYSKIFVGELPASDPDVNGQLWNDGGVLCISQSENNAVHGTSPLNVVLSNQESLVISAKSTVIDSVPTSDPSISGHIWNNGGIVSVSETGTASALYSPEDYADLQAELSELFPAYITPYYISKITS